MIKISRQVDYGLQLMFALERQKKGEYLSLQKFSQKSDISFLFLQKIARQLRRAGLVAATRGPNGGYSLRRPSNRVSLKEVIEAMEGPYGISSCNRPGGLCAKLPSCPVKPGMKSLQDRLVSLMSETTVADLART